jgi:hypothetical protein
MTQTPAQLAVYNFLLGMNNNGPLTDGNRAALLAVDFARFGITEDDKKQAIRQYEHVIGLTLKAA